MFLAELKTLRYSYIYEQSCNNDMIIFPRLCCGYTRKPVDVLKQIRIGSTQYYMRMRGGSHNTGIINWQALKADDYASLKYCKYNYGRRCTIQELTRESEYDNVI